LNKWEGNNKRWCCIVHRIVCDLLQGNFRAVPIAEGRKVLSELGQRNFALGGEQLPGHLAVLSSISQKNLKVTENPVLTLSIPEAAQKRGINPEERTAS
jgi:hypothetical protein